MRYRLNLLLAVLTCRSRPNGNSRLPGARPRSRPRTYGGVSASSPPTRCSARDAEPQLDQVAAYVAAEFRRFGLKPRRQRNLPAALPARSAALRSGQREHPGRRPSTHYLAHRSGRAAGRRTATAGDSAGAGVVITGSPQGAARARLHGRDREGDLSRVRAQRERDRGEGPAASTRSRCYSWRTSPTRSGRSCRPRGERARAQSERGRRIHVPAVFAVRAGTARALFTRAGVPPDSLRVWGDRPLAAHPLPDVRMQLAVHQQLLERTSAPTWWASWRAGTPPSSRSTCCSRPTWTTSHAGSGRGVQRPRRRLDLQRADDDGSGTVAVMELAQAFTTARERPQALPGLHDRERRRAGVYGVAPISRTTPRCRSRASSRT